MKPVLTVLSALVGTALPCGAGADDVPKLPHFCRFFQQLRSESEDVIQLTDGKLLRGRVLNENVTIATEYATATLPVRRCAWISFENPRPCNDEIVTVNSNRLSGLVTDRIIRLHDSSSGKDMTVRKENARFILLRRTSDEADFMKERKKTDVFLMANGDLLSGRTTERKVSVRTVDGNVRMSLKEMRWMAMVVDGNVTAAPVEGDETLIGMPDLDTMSLELDVGPVLPAVHVSTLAEVLLCHTPEEVPAQFGILLPKPSTSDAATSESADRDVITNEIGMQLRFVAPGEFTMGSPADEEGHAADETQHAVKLTDGFYLGATEVTQAQWNRVMGTNPSAFQSWIRPVDSVSWYDAVAFCEKLSEMEGKTYRLPSEAEWEYACRAGGTAAFSTRAWFNRDSANWGGIGDFPNYDSTRRGKRSYREQTAPVGSFPPNAWGLYDMHGNVKEWCADWYGPYGRSDSVNPKGVTSGSMRVLRGGAWISEKSECRSAYRHRQPPDVDFFDCGFRVVLDVSGRSGAQEEADDGVAEEEPAHDLLAEGLVLAHWVKASCTDKNLTLDECLAEFKKDFPEVWEKYGDVIKKLISQGIYAE